MIKFSRPSRLCDACRHMAMGVAIWRWVSPEVDTCRQMAMSVAVARYRRHKNLSTAMASPWREGSRRVVTAVAKVVQQAQCCYQIVFNHGGHVVTATGAAQGSVTPVMPQFYFKSMQHSTANRTLPRPTRHKPG